MTDSTPAASAQRSCLLQTLVGAGVVLVAVGLAAGAMTIPSAAGYAGVGPNFLPWLVAFALGICGAFLLYEARTGGFRDMDDAGADGAAATGPQINWASFVWMSAGLLLNAALITTVGFVLSCALCFALAAHGLRRSGEESSGLRSWLVDAAIGLCIAAPVFWMFTKFLAINLPGLTQTGWL